MQLAQEIQCSPRTVKMAVIAWPSYCTLMQQRRRRISQHSTNSRTSTFSSTTTGVRLCTT
jgi:hypothetical protein